MMWLSETEILPNRMKLLQEVVTVEKSEQNEIFGESLPTGLILSS